MIDSGVTHSFVSEQLVERLNLHRTPTAELEVTLADGSRFVCSDKVSMEVVAGSQGKYGPHV